MSADLIGMVVALFLPEAPLDEGPGSRPIDPSNTSGEK
jgi:hypothetical protein